MIIKSKVTMDLNSPGYPALIGSVQNDRYTRALEITLTDGGEAWSVPEDVSALVCYSRADGSWGQYDTLPNGECAWSAEENLLTVILAPQLLAVPGAVRIWVALIRNEQQISTFAAVLKVHRGTGTGEAESDGWGNVTGFLPGTFGAKEGQFLRISQVNEAGYVTAVEPVDPEDFVLPVVTEADNGRILQVVNGVWECAQNGLPDAAQAQEGQFLRVCGGVWCPVTVENAEGVSF